MQEVHLPATTTTLLACPLISICKKEEGGEGYFFSRKSVRGELWPVRYSLSSDAGPRVCLAVQSNEGRKRKRRKREGVSRVPPSVG